MATNKRISKKRQNSKSFAASRQGFTLIEMIVGIFIIVTLTALLLVNYHSTNKKSELINAAQKLASDIRLAQQFSLGSKEFQGSVPAGGWGVSLNSSENAYKIFADADGDGIYDSGSEDYKAVNMPQGISLSVFDCDTLNPKTQDSALFVPPDPDVVLSANKLCASLTDGASSKNIEVNLLGLIDVY
jgi:prepilin-type N-terminal cleavage/methylation domain-containing protein